MNPESPVPSHTSPFHDDCAIHISVAATHATVSAKVPAVPTAVPKVTENVPALFPTALAKNITVAPLASTFHQGKV